MFDKLRKNIVRTIMLSTIFLALLVSVLSFAILSTSYYRDYRTAARESIDQKIMLSGFTFENVMRASRQLSENENFIALLRDEGFNPQVTPALNTLKNSSFGIYAATVYVPGGPTYTTFNVSDVVTLEAFNDYPPVAAFMNGGESSMLSIRTTHIAGIYNNVRYLDEFGMITHIVKLKDNGTVMGYLFVDINPAYVYGTLFDYSAHPQFAGTTTFLIGEDDEPLLPAVNLRPYRQYVTESAPGRLVMSGDLSYLIGSHVLYGEHRVVSVIPLGPYYRTLLSNGVILIGLNLIIIGGAYLLARRIERNVADPLSRLKTKMARSETRLKDQMGG